MLDDGASGITDPNGGTGWAVEPVVGADNQFSDHVSVTMVPAAAVPIDAAVLAPPLAATWKTVGNNVPAFSEPDDSGGSISMPTHVDLDLVEERGAWGLFEYQSGGGMRARAWIAMKDVLREQ